MKREDIEPMETGRELDVLVAKEIFGIEVEWDYSPWDINHVAPKLPYRKGEPRTVLGPMTHPVSNTIFEYSTDISVAWQVMEKTEFDAVWILRGTPNKYCVGYTRGDMNDLFCYSRELDTEECLSPICDTLPEAICKASLMMK